MDIVSNSGMTLGINRESVVLALHSAGIQAVLHRFSPSEARELGQALIELAEEADRDKDKGATPPQARAGIGNPRTT